MGLYPLLRPIVFALEAERAHRLTLRLLRLVPAGLPARPDPMLGIEVAGIAFPNPVGLAAGFDKDAVAFRQLLGFGFGFVEVGTVTPRPQAGNAQPRLFRLAADRAVINRMGFNNAGQESARERLAKRKGRPSTSPTAPLRTNVVGVNVGANKESHGDEAIADYVAGVRAMAPVADYLTLNISSPNTPGLRALQDSGTLDALLAGVAEARPANCPIFLKVAPDLEPGDADRIARAAIDARIDALIVGNTTVTRPDLVSRHSGQAGGLSGAPLKTLALARLREFRAAAGGQLPLIACGGIENGVDAFERILAGASLVQLYTALVYEGPELAARINGELRRLMALRGFARLSEAVGAGR